jgi:hypothetical protein
MKQAVYTANFGNNFDDPKPVLKPNPSWDYIYFTDNSELASKSIPGWNKIIYLPPDSLPHPDDPRRSSKYPKILPHKYLPEYGRTIWVDASYQITGDIGWIANPHEDVDFAIAIHPGKRKNIYEEADMILLRGFDKPEIVNAQMDRYRSEGLEARTIYQCGVMIRYNKPSVNKLMERWLEETGGINSIRDQLSLPYVLWKTPVNEMPVMKKMAQQHIEFIMKWYPHNRKYNNINYIQPYGYQLKLGDRLNEEISRLPEDEWIVIMDQDCCSLVDKLGDVLNSVINRYGDDTDLFSAYASRLGLSYQVPPEGDKENYDIRFHHNIAQDRLKKYQNFCIDINKPVAGFFMMFKKSTWHKHKFQSEIIDRSKEINGKRGVYFDYDWSNRILKSGGKIRLCEGLYFLHCYRLNKDIKDVRHLETKI